MKRSVVIKRLGYEASAGRTTYGTSLAAFSLFQGVATRLKVSSDGSWIITGASSPIPYSVCSETAGWKQWFR